MKESIKLLYYKENDNYYLLIKNIDDVDDDEENDVIEFNCIELLNDYILNLYDKYDIIEERDISK